MVKKYRRRTKRNYKRKRRYKKPSPTNCLGPLSNTLKTKMIYEDQFQLDPNAVGAASQYFFKANGLYDPNYTGVGHQPRGFDQLMALYDHFVVIGAKLTLWIANTDSTDSNMITLHIQDDYSPTGDPTDILERRFIKAKCFSGESGGINSGTMSIAVNPPKFLGRSKPLSDPDLKGNSSGDPSEKCYFVVSAFPATSGQDTSPVSVRARIEYTTILIEPRQPTAS